MDRHQFQHNWNFAKNKHLTGGTGRNKSDEDNSEHEHTRKGKKKAERVWSSTLLHINDLLPRISVGYVIPPPGHILPLSEAVSSSVGGGDQVVRVRKVREISERELITGQETSLTKPLLVHVEHLGKLLFVLLDDPFVLLELHPWSECQLEHQCWAGWAEALPFSLHPLIYGGLRQGVCPVQSLVPSVPIFLTNVPAYCSWFWIEFCNPAIPKLWKLSKF